MVKVSLSQKICNAIPATGIAFMGMVISAGMLKYYTDYIGVNPFFFGIANLLATIWGSINTPILGYYLTKMRPKPGIGKFKKLMLFSAPLMFLGFLIIVSMRPSWSQFSLFQVLIIGSFLYTISGVIFNTSLGGIGANLTDDLDERAKISTLSAYFNQIPGAILGMVPLVFLSGDYPYDFLLTGLIILGVIGASILLIASYLIEERNEWYQDLPDPMGPIKALKECVKAKGWIIFIIYSMCSLIPSNMFLVGIVYYLGNVWRVWGFWAILPGAIGGGLQLIAFYPIILKIRKKIGTYRTMFIFQFLNFFGYFGFLIAPNYGVMFFSYIIILTALSGTNLANMLADVDIIDADMVHTGERRAPMFGGIKGLFVAPIGGIAVSLFTIILEMTGYNATPGAVQTPEVLLGIRFAIGGFSMIFIGISIVLWRFFPFHGEFYRELRVIVENKFNDTLEHNGTDLKEEDR